MNQKGANNCARCIFVSVFFISLYEKHFLLILFNNCGHFIKYSDYTNLVHLHSLHY